MVLFSSRRRRQRETREKGRERRVQSASISHDRQRERSRGKRTTSGDSEDDDEHEDEGTKGRRTSDDVHDVSNDREGDDALARESTLEYLNFWGKRQSISVTKTRHERSRVVVVIACLTARSTTRLLRPRTTTRTTTRVVLVQE